MCFIFVSSVIVSSIISCNDLYQDFIIIYVWYFVQSQFNICVRCDMAFIEPMHRNKPNITYLLPGSERHHPIKSIMHNTVKWIYYYVSQ